MSPSTGYVLVLTTTPDRESASIVSRVVLEKRLGACVQVFGPIESSYWWKGEIESSEEWLVLVKTASRLVEDLKREISRVHPYEVPEMVALPLVAGLEAYFSWMDSVLEKRDTG